MPRRHLFWQIFLGYACVTAAALAVLAVYAARAASSFHEASIRADLEARALLMVDPIQDAIVRNEPDSVQNLCAKLGPSVATRITVVLPSGLVIGDSDESPANMDNHANRPEIAEAMAGGVGQSIRFSHTRRQNFMYVAIPLNDGGRLVGVLRTAVPFSRVQEALWTNKMHILLATSAVGLLGALASWGLSRRIARPLEHLRQGAHQYAQGDFEHRLRVSGADEIAELAQAMNHMAEQLDERIRTIVNQRNQQEAVLSSMIEGVIAVDAEKRIISLNRSAAHMLGLAADDVHGRGIETVVRNTALQEFIDRSLDSPSPIEGEFVLHAESEQTVQAHGAVLRDSVGNGLGAVIVLNDVTRLRRLEQVRQDFVANVSHELKTPITSIKGFVETLLDGALANPEDARRFLEIVDKQAERLTAILEDLLVLSRTEAGARRKGIPLERSSLPEVLNAAVTLCQPKAQARGIEIHCDCPNTLEARINAPLLEQAVTNLIDNAVKYSDTGGFVHIATERENDEVVIRVQDHGVGIPPEHLPRLFERFYRVDKARSRNLGGTGLGLSIVKHIVQAHEGRVEVESTPGKGSTFSIHLPA